MTALPVFPDAPAEPAPWPGLRRGPIEPPDADVYRAARARFTRLTTPQGGLGGLDDLAAWVASCQQRPTPWLVSRVRAVVLAGDHGVSDRSPDGDQPTTLERLTAVTAGTAPVAVLAREHNVRLRCYDVGVAAELPPELASLARYKMGRATRPIDRADASTPARAELDLFIGELVATTEITVGADLLVLGDLGQGHRLAAAAFVAASLGLRGEHVVGRFAGVDGRSRTQAVRVVNEALDRVGERIADPVQRVAALGSPALAVGAGAMVTAARRGVPILLDGLVSVAQALLAEELAPGVAGWCRAAHGAPDPAHQAALAALRLVPVLDLGLRQEDGTGALVALPVLRAAVRLLRDLDPIERDLDDGPAPAGSPSGE